MHGVGAMHKHVQINKKNRQRWKMMETLFHPVSGEKLYCYTAKEQELVKLALHELASVPLERDGVLNG